MAKRKVKEPEYTDIVWRELEANKKKKIKAGWHKVWLKGDKIVRVQKFDQPYSD